MNDQPAIKDQRRPSLPPWVPYLVVLGLVTFFYISLSQIPNQQEVTYDIPYSEFKRLVAQGWVVEVEFKGNSVRGELDAPAPIGPREEESQYFRSHIPSFGDETLLSELEEHRVKIRVREEVDGSGWTVLLAFLPWLIFIFLFIWLMRGGIGGGRFGGPPGAKKFLQAATKKVEVPDVKFDDVAGQENAKREITELVDYLKKPEKFQKLGAEIPRGVLLMGPPGTGKTLLARALAGEAGVPFYSISGSEFIELYVGVGAARVRNLFDTAKENSPSIIFVDELDSIGRTRGTGLGGGHDEREQTLNQILAEMDGFSAREVVIVLAATNRPDVLDPALLRPGRFDRHVTLDLPDIGDRLAILKVHMRKVRRAGDVGLKDLAASTPGFSGADIKNLINEAAILAAREKHTEVLMRHFEEARDKLLMGTVRTLAIQPEEKHRLAVHEAGHTLMAYFMSSADPVYKVTIIPRGKALGMTQQLPEEEHHTMPEDYLRDRLVVMLGGRTAERELLGTLSSGADDDIRQATSLARAMVARWGMSEQIGPVDLRESEEHPFLGREMAQPRRFSEHSAEAVDKAVRELLVEAEERAVNEIKRHRQNLERLINMLEEQETLHREQIERCLNPAQPAGALKTISS